jgi:hypothetical protein
MFPRIPAIPQFIHFMSALSFPYPTNSTSLCCCDRSVAHVCNIANIIGMESLLKLSFLSLTLFALPLSLECSESMSVRPDGHFAILPDLLIGLIYRRWWKFTTESRSLSLLHGASTFSGWRRRPADMKFRCEYIECAIADSRQGVVLQRRVLTRD